MAFALLLFLGSQPIAMLLVSVYLLLFYFIWLLCPFRPPSAIFFLCALHSLSLPSLSSCLDCIPPLIGLPFLRSLLRSVSYGCLLFVSSVCAFFVCFSVSCWFIFIFVFFVFLPGDNVLCWLPDTFLSVVFCLISLYFSFLFFFFSEIVPGLILFYFQSTL